MFVGIVDHRYLSPQIGALSFIRDLINCLFVAFVYCQKQKFSIILSSLQIESRIPVSSKSRSCGDSQLTRNIVRTLIRPPREFPSLWAAMSISSSPFIWVPALETSIKFTLRVWENTPPSAPVIIVLELHLLFRNHELRCSTGLLQFIVRGRERGSGGAEKNSLTHSLMIILFCLLLRLDEIRDLFRYLCHAVSLTWKQLNKLGRN